MSSPSSVPREMRAAVYARDADQGVAIAPRPVPRASLRGAVCRVKAVGLNPVDAKFVIGDKFGSWMLPAVRRLVDQRTVGFDFSGVVVEAPPESGLRSGDPVFGTVPPLAGSLSEYILAPLDQIARKPASLSFVEAAALPLVGLTAVQSMRDDHGLRPGQRVLIIGASGGVGHVAVQVAKALGAHVTGICSQKNAALVRRLGADEVIDYVHDDIVATLRRGVDAGGPFDLCLDCVSSHDARDSGFAYEEHIRGVKPALLTGTYVTIGGFTHQWLTAGIKRVFGLNLFPRGRELYWIRLPKSAPGLEVLRGWVEAGQLRPIVAETVRFDDAGVRAGFASLHSRRVVGKVVVALDDDSAPVPAAG